MTDKKTMTISGAVERMITAVNIVTGDDGHRSQEAVKTFLELLKMEDKDYNKQQKYYGQIMEDKEAIIEEVIAICKANNKNMYCDKYQLIDMIREALKLYEN